MQLELHGKRVLVALLIQPVPEFIQHINAQPIIVCVSVFSG